ncbi:MAG: stage II sporulation protein D [bacterium]|nr:stage II sporulation protein D [bacterium]
MKNKILALISVILIPFTIISLLNQDATNNQSADAYLASSEILINFSYNNETISLPIEEYLIGVLGAESPASFNIEALKAQAVASRTFALYQQEKRGYVTTGDQAFATEEELKTKWQTKYDEYYNKIKAAITSTQNEVLYYDNKLIKAYFYAMSNGYTTTSLAVFNEELPYLNIIIPTLDNSNTNNFEVTKTISKTQFCEKLALDCNKLNISTPKRDESNRVTMITINNREYTGLNLRQQFNLRSTDFTLQEDQDNIIITTKGYGHGVGMSQYGANAMAKNGASYQDILQFYYQGTEIKKFNV